MQLILSAAKSDLMTTDNEQRQLKLLKYLCDDVDFSGSFRPVHGSYKGVPEKSVLVDVSTAYQRTRILELAFKVFDQESVLVIMGDGTAGLHYSSGIAVPLPGKFQPTTLEQAGDAYTIINNAVYTVKE